MAKSKGKKLKVFRTPIGFHDAYVAAPSQKAALEAWGTDTNLFARGSAEQVTEPELMAVPLEHPGHVVKVLRGTKAEQLAALSKQGAENSAKPRPSSTAQAEVVPRKPKRKAPKPNRSAVTKAEDELKKLEEQQAKEIGALEKKERELERERRDLLRSHERERDKAQERLDDEKEKYRAALDRYERG